MNTPWAVILCKFTDSNTEPFPKQYYVDLYSAGGGGSPWNLVRYFDAWSHGAIDLTGSKVFGWYPLDKSLADYNALGQGARKELLKWARAAAAAAGEDLSGFFSVVAVTNVGTDIGGGPSGVVCQGPENPNQRSLAHEMGHTYGMSHSRKDGSDDDYMDKWDIMSAANTYSEVDPKFMFIGPGINAWNMRGRGWLDESRVWQAPSSGFDQTVTLRPLGSRELPGWLAAEIPGGLLVEFRMEAGWDAAIPQSVVLIHRFQGNNSYLMPGDGAFSSGLAVGNSFGSPEPDGSVTDLLTGYLRVDVESIDEAGQTATIRVRYNPGFRANARAIDPLSLILSTEAYLIWLEIHDPHEPKVADLQRALQVMAPREREAALVRARSLMQYGRLAEEAILGLETRIEERG